MKTRTIALVLLVCSMFACTTDPPPTLPALAAQAHVALDQTIPPPPKTPPVVCEDFILESGDTLGRLLDKASVSHKRRPSFLRQVAQQMPLKRIRPGLVLTRCQKDSKFIELRLSKPNSASFLRLIPSNLNEWHMTQESVPLTRRTRLFALKVTFSIGEAVASAQAHLSLTPALAEVLAWDLDLRRDVKRNDELRVLINEISLPNGKFLKYGPILAIKYLGTERQFSMYAYETEDTGIRYFDASGASVERSLLSTPMKFVRISSTFSSKRKHPILGYTKAHNGVDYAAPTGTPIWSVGRGRVTYAGWKGANGKLIRIDHGNGITTAYAHLSQIMPSIKRGAQVKPKQHIGKVGTTGRSTGPHLHFAMKKNGRFVNPLKVSRPRLSALSPSQMPQFKIEVLRLNQLLTDLAVDTQPVQP